MSTTPAPTPTPAPAQNPNGNPHRTRNIILAVVGALACLGLVAVLAIGAIGFGIFAAVKESEPTGATRVDAPLAAPRGTSVDQPYLELSTAADGPVVDVYLDFLCPHCATFADTNSADLRALAEAGEITLRVHPRSMLDPNSTPAGYSGRAANAAVCAYAQDPALWFPVEKALFEAQPGAEGLSDEQLTELVQGAGASAEVADCITYGTYLAWITEVVEPEAMGTTGGTPTVLIDGEQYLGEIDQPGALREAIEAA